jgi:hypothetical protein
MIFEIKRSGNANLAFVGKPPRRFWSACIAYNATQVIGCLTDVSTWHFMSCDSTPSVTLFMSEVLVDISIHVASSKDSLIPITNIAWLHSR